MATLSVVFSLAFFATQISGLPGDLKTHKYGKSKIAVQPTFTNRAHVMYEELLYIYNKQQGNNSVPRPKTLTPCARAILGCCGKGQLEEICSVEVGCGAYAFDVNPCDEIFVKDALEAARAYYGQFTTKPIISKK